MKNFADKFRRYGKFNISEVKAITITIIILTMIVAFNDKSEIFSFSNWIGNFIIWLAIVSVSVIVKTIGHKLMGTLYGFRVEYKLWWYGLLISLAVMLASAGNIWLLLPGGIIIHHLAVHRIGWWRYGLNMRALALISFSGPLACIIFATFIKTIQLWTPFVPAESILIDRIYLFNLAFAAFSMLPIPPLDGSRIMFNSRLLYSFTAGCIISYAVLAYLQIYSWIFALILGILILSFYYYSFEK
jgi:Zn-dependent protease